MSQSANRRFPWRTALVTGASSGIGEAFARELASAGVDLVLVGRDAGRLGALADGLERTRGISVEPMATDLSSPVARSTVEKRLADPDHPVDLLVNNAGFGTSGRFVDLPVAREEQQIHLNVVAVMRLSAAVLPSMVERGHGNILNVGSVAGLYPTPDTATYGATKAFVCSFSDALHEELRGTGVVVTVSLPGLTRTRFHERSGSPTTAPAAAWLDPAAVARASLEAAAAGRARVVPGALYRTVAAAIGPVPPGPRRWLYARLRGLVR